MSHRVDLNTLMPAQRAQLVSLMLTYLTDPVVAAHTAIVHSGLELFTGHRAYLLGMENFLTANGGAAFTPLPFWNAGNPIPAEFGVVKNPGPTRPALGNLNPQIPMPPQFEYPAVCEYDDPAQLGNDINGWHGSVHIAIGGTMAILSVASAAPIFWCWHAFVDHIYWDWQRCTVPCPDVTGCTLGIAKLKLRAAGLCAGTITRIPRCCLPPDRCIPVVDDADPSRYLSHGGHTPDPEPHDHSDHGHSQHDHSEHDRSKAVPSDMKPPQKPSRTKMYAASPEKDPRTPRPSDEFLHPKPDYSYLLRGPRVVAQAPIGHTTAKIGGCVDLTVVE